MMKILKFGGKSLGTIEKTQKICKYIKKIYENNKKLIIVVSAMGQSTDNLMQLVEKFNPSKCAKRELDALLSTGETISASVFAIILNHYCVPAKSLQAWQVKINTMGDFQNSLITSIDKKVIEENLSKNIVTIVTGFQGVNKFNDITTLGRGGSDTTASALGATFNCNVEFYSDFNGMFACDPRQLKCKKFDRISLEQLDFAGQAGSKILSNRAVKIAKEHGISLQLKQSSKPKLKGTLVNNIESNQICIHINTNLCEIIIDLANETNQKILLKNVIIWLNNYKIYNLISKFNYISILVNQSDKEEILNTLKEKLKL